MNIVDEEGINRALEKNRNPSDRKIRSILKKALKLRGLNINDTASLLNINPENTALMRKLFTTAFAIKNAIYGNRLVLFAPVYVSSHCSNDCLYCGFRKSNKNMRRRILTDDELRQEVEILERQGHKRLLMLMGDDFHEYSLDDFVRAIGIAYSVKETLPVEGFKAIPGKGAEGKVGGKNVLVVSPGYLRENNIMINDDRIKKLSSQGKTVVFVMIEGDVEGALALADIIRPESKKAVSMLKDMNVKCMMLTGDNKQVAKWVADEIGLDEYFAEVLPQEKAAKIKEVQARGLTVAMTGDGVNDAPALAQADVGIAIGAGTDVAVETADIILVKSNPLDIVAIIGLARATYNKMVQNLLWATGYNIFAIPLAAGVLYAYGILLTPALGALFMSFSTVIVAVNAQLLKIKQG